MKGKNKNKIISFVAAGLFVLTGTYNAVVINSESLISSTEVKFVKRLDEVYGVTVPGRVVAASASWQKLAPSVAPKNQEIKKVEIAKVETASEAAPVDLIPAAAVQEELSLSLIEVINPTKWKDGLKAGQFHGVLSTNQGVIEDLNISLPNGEGVAVSFSEMTGNVFEYDLNGELYSGMMYQVDQNAYMVTLTNGPLEGTRLRFSNQTPVQEQEQTAQYLADNNIEVGNFGSEPSYENQTETSMDYDQQIQQQSMQAQGFNFDQNQTM
jgi:hypothetical protein